MVSSIRSRQTGHVGSSTRSAVGGGNGLVVSGVLMDDGESAPVLGCAFGLKGSLFMSG